MSSKSETLKLPKDWAPEFNRVVVDPDGWRDGAPDYPDPKSWDVPITRKEYQARLGVSTTRPR